jgi:hypothetical protein
MSVMPALGRLRKGKCKSEASVGYITRPQSQKKKKNIVKAAHILLQ